MSRSTRGVSSQLKQVRPQREQSSCGGLWPRCAEDPSGADGRRDHGRDQAQSGTPSQQTDWIDPTHQHGSDTAFDREPKETSFEKRNGVPGQFVHMVSVVRAPEDRQHRTARKQRSGGEQNVPVPQERALIAVLSPADGTRFRLAAGF